MINFVNTGADEDILKSMSTEGCSEDLIKAMSKQGLVQKDVTVQGKNGKTFTRKQWVKASDTKDGGSSKSSQQTIKPDEPAKSDSSVWQKKLEDALHSASGTSADYAVGQVLKELPKGTVIKTGQKAMISSPPYEVEVTYTKGDYDGWQYISKDYDTVYFNSVSKSLCKAKDNPKFKLSVSVPKSQSDSPVSQGTSKEKPDISFDKPADGDTKKAIQQMLASGKSRKDIMSAAEAAGITWTKNDHEGINWMRASMAIQKDMKAAKTTSTSQPVQTAQGGSSQSDIKHPKIFREDSSLKVSGGGYAAAGGRSQMMITRSSAKQYIMIQATKRMERGVNLKNNIWSMVTKLQRIHLNVYLHLTLIVSGVLTLIPWKIRIMGGGNRKA